MANLRKIATYLAERKAIEAGVIRRLPRRRKGATIEMFLPEVPTIVPESSLRGVLLKRFCRF